MKTFGCLGPTSEQLNQNLWVWNQAEVFHKSIPDDSNDQLVLKTFAEKVSLTRFQECFTLTAFLTGSGIHPLSFSPPWATYF